MIVTNVIKRKRDVYMQYVKRPTRRWHIPIDYKFLFLIRVNIQASNFLFAVFTKYVQTVSIIIDIYNAQKTLTGCFAKVKLQYFKSTF